jgi:hypothetical protein
MTVSDAGSRARAWSNCPTRKATASPRPPRRWPGRRAVRRTGRRHRRRPVLESYQVHSVGMGADARGEANLSVRYGGRGVRRHRHQQGHHRSQRAGLAGRGQPLLRQRGKMKRGSWLRLRNSPGARGSPPRSDVIPAAGIQHLALTPSKKHSNMATFAPP